MNPNGEKRCYPWIDCRVCGQIDRQQKVMSVEFKEDL